MHPRWFIEKDDHDLAACIRGVFAPFPFKLTRLQQSFMTLGLIPEELWTIFDQVVVHEDMAEAVITSVSP